MAQRICQLAILDHVDLGAQDRERRAQLMRGVGGKLPLRAETGIEPVERLVDRAHQRQHLARHAGFRQSELDAVGADLSGQGRSDDQRLHRPPKDRDVDDQEQQQDGCGNPPHMGQELGQDVVDQHVAVQDVFDDLDPHRAVAEIRRHTRPIKRHAVAVLSKKFDRLALRAHRGDRADPVLLKKLDRPAFRPPTGNRPISRQ